MIGKNGGYLRFDLILGEQKLPQIWFVHTPQYDDLRFVRIFQKLLLVTI